MGEPKWDAPTRETLASLALLRNVQLESVLGLLERCEVRRLGEGETLIEAGQENDTLFVVLSGRLRVVLDTEDEAVAELTKRFGPDMAKWQWGQEGYHHALIRHPLADAVNEATRAKLNVGPLPRGGSGDTVSATGGGDNQTSGGSFKLIADTENWDNSIGLNNPGQSGNPDSPEYRNLFEMWAKGRYFPVAYSRAKVESVTQSVIQLTPATTSTQQR